MFLDFAKAFDRVNHKVLLHKLCDFRISGSLLAWCGDYLSNRKQRVVGLGLGAKWSSRVFLSLRRCLAGRGKELT